MAEQAEDWRKLENIVLPKERIRAQDYSCSICLQIWDDPVETKCGHIFCSSCLGGSLACPECREAWTEADKPKKVCDHNKPMFRRMNSLGVRCPHSMTAGWGQDESDEPASKRRRQDAVDGGSGDARSSISANNENCTGTETVCDETCDWQGNYADLLSIHIKKCGLWFIPCPAGCGESLRRKDLSAHEVTCSKTFLTCPICQDLVKDMEAHRADPEMKDRHVQLLEKKVADLENSRTTDAIVKTIETGLGTANANIAKLSAELRKTQEFFSTHASAHVAYVWELANFDILCAASTPGQKRSSPSFFMGGVGPLHIDVYPAGYSAAEDDVALYLVNGSEHALTMEGSLELSVSKDDSAVARDKSFSPKTMSFDLMQNKVPAGKGWGMIKFVAREAIQERKTVWIVADLPKFGRSMKTTF